MKESGPMTNGKLRRVSKADYLMTVVYNGETINARCETETQARFLASLLQQPNPDGIEEISVVRMRGMEFAEKILHLGREA